jgi:hypothetical protein
LIRFLKKSNKKFFGGPGGDFSKKPPEITAVGGKKIKFLDNLLFHPDP